VEITSPNLNTYGMTLEFSILPNNHSVNLNMDLNSAPPQSQTPGEAAKLTAEKCCAADTTFREN